MIAALEGKIEIIGEDSLVIKTTSGVGYVVFCSNGVISSAKIGKNINLFIETIVKEDSLTLYGFPSFKELIWFKSFLKIGGIGAKLGMSIISSFSISDIIFAIESEDKSFFCTVSGLGPKIAARIVSEMKKEPKKNAGLLQSTVLLNQEEQEISHYAETANIFGEIARDASLALEALGFQKNASYMAALAIVRENPASSVNEVIKLALKKLG
jgi:Holliday junction DNA helicase RuvA